MWQLVFANISIQGWVIDSDQHGFSDGSNHALVFPDQYVEIVQRHFMSSGVIMVTYGLWCSHAL